MTWMGWLHVWTLFSGSTKEQYFFFHVQHFTEDLGLGSNRHSDSITPGSLYSLDRKLHALPTRVLHRLGSLLSACAAHVLGGEAAQVHILTLVIWETWWSDSWFLFFFFVSTRNWTQGLELTRQALYYLSHASSSFAFSLFSDTVSFLPGWPRFLLLSSKNYRCETPWSATDSISILKLAEYFLFSPIVPASLWVHHGDFRFTDYSMWQLPKDCSLGVWRGVLCTPKPVRVFLGPCLEYASFFCLFIPSSRDKNFGFCYFGFFFHFMLFCFQLVL
jgi:hypothetical protein